MIEVIFALAVVFLVVVVVNNVTDSLPSDKRR